MKLILHGLSRDGKGLAGQSGSLSLRAKGNNRFTLCLHRDWESLLQAVRIRQLAASATLQVMLGTIYETLADQSRSRNLSNGIFLSTVHSIKGL
ncbi:MAG: hypothetical protein GY799_04835 [Desulfobulbaceae bacterium]|nr:hypothetical protein [Desulfobulbaceae bacterium]